MDKWIVMRVQKFDLVQDKGNLIVQVNLDSGLMSGYLPVYDTKEDAEAEYPDGPFGQIREIE